MEGPFLSTPAKRPFHSVSGMVENNTYSGNGESKRGRFKPPPTPIALSPGQVSLRLLCQASTVGGIIGKSGSVIKQLQQETGAKIRVEDTVSSCDERVIHIVAPESPKKKITLKGANDEQEEHEVSPVQEALVKVFERVLKVYAETEGGFPSAGGFISCRLLGNTSQVGSLMGKGGSTIEKIKKESSSKIRVLSPEKLPTCASPTDQVIEILGGALAVKRALLAVSLRLLDSSSVEKLQKAGSRPVKKVPRRNFPDIRGELAPNQIPPAPISSVDYGSRGHPMKTEIDSPSTLDPKNEQQNVSFRLLCSNDKIGGVIGKGGSIVRTLEIETRASISIGASVSGSEERVITVSALENPESRFSPAQHALVRVFTRSIEVGIEKGLESGSSEGAPTSARLLIQSNEVGCLMGKGGAKISELRTITGTGIRIFGRDQVPKCASENDQLVQITGEFENVQDALMHVTGKLRDNLFPNKMSHNIGSGSYSSYANSENSPYARMREPTSPIRMQDNLYRSEMLNSTRSGSYTSFAISEISPYGRMREPTSPGFYPSMSLSHNLDPYSTRTHSTDYLGLSRSLDRPLSPRLWTSQKVKGANFGDSTDSGKDLTTLRGGLELGSGSKSAMVTNTTMEIVVPEEVLGCIYGENGCNLTRLRTISGAKVIVHDPAPGESEGKVIISGMPDQTQIAQSLLQAFISSGPSPKYHSRLL